MGGRLATAENFGDRRDQEAPHTKTHFELRRFASLAEWEAQQPGIQPQILDWAGL